MFYKIKKNLSLEFILILTFIISLPLKSSLNSLSLILISVYTFYVYLKNKKFNKIIFKYLIPFIIYFILVVVSHFYTENKEYSLKLISRFLSFLLFPFIFSIIKIERVGLKKLLKFFVYWMSILAIYSHILMFIKLYKNNDILFNLFNLNYSYINLANTIGLHSTYYALLMLMSTVFLINFIFKERKKRVLVFYFLILLYQSFFIFHLSARTPIVALFVLFNISILYYFFKNQQIKKGILVLLTLYIFTGIIGYNVRTVRYRFQHVFGFTYSDGTHHDDGINKIKQWQAAIDANNNFLFGNSVADADASIIKSNKKHGLLKYAQEEYNAHNQFIQTYVGLGILGLFFLLFLFVYYFTFFYKTNSFLGFVTVILFFILFQTESYLQRHIGIVFFPFLIGLFVNLKSIKRN